MEKQNFIPCLTFVARGKANKHVEKVKHTKEELHEIIKELKLKEAEYESRPNAERRMSQQEQSDDDDNAVDDYYEMDNYDDEPTEAMADAGIENLILENPPESDSEDSDAEPDEFTVKPDDNLILVGHVDDDVTMLEVYVFNHENADFFLLHDIFLPSYPLAVEWLDFNPKAADVPGHFAALGYITNEIEIWDLNVSGCLEPTLCLGGKKAKKAERHSDAVLDLSWNTQTRNILASGSADHTVRLWDMATKSTVLKLSVFEEKVQSLKFHPMETQSLLTGSCDGYVKLFDCRSPSTNKSWLFEKEIERVMWNPFEPFHFFASTDTGMVHYVDIRSSEPIWNLSAVQGAEGSSEITGLCLSGGCQDMLLTGSTDGAVRVWDIKDGKPTLVCNKTMNVGSIYSIAACPDVPYVFCVGGNNKDNQMYLWDSRESEAVINRFRDRELQTFVTAETGENTDTSGQINLSKKKKKKKEVEGARADADAEPQPGPSSSSTSTASKSKKKKDRKKMHPKTPK